MYLASHFDESGKYHLVDLLCIILRANLCISGSLLANIRLWSLTCCWKCFLELKGLGTNFFDLELAKIL